MASWRNLHVSQNLEMPRNGLSRAEGGARAKALGCGLSPDRMRQGLDSGGLQVRELGWERRLWGQAGD